MLKPLMPSVVQVIVTGSRPAETNSAHGDAMLLRRQRQSLSTVPPGDTLVLQVERNGVLTYLVSDPD